MGRKKGDKTAIKRGFYLYERDEKLLGLIKDKMNEDPVRDKDATESDALRDCIRGSMQRYGITKGDLTTALKPAAD